MFSKSKRGEGSAARTVQAAPSIISADLRILGDIVCEGDVQVEGVIEGDVRTRSLTVGEHALIKGTVVCDHARVRGTVDGEIFSRNVILARTARVKGDITHESIAIEAGAYLDGRCRRIEEGEADIAALAEERIGALANERSSLAVEDKRGAKGAGGAADKDTAKAGAD